MEYYKLINGIGWHPDFTEGRIYKKYEKLGELPTMTIKYHVNSHPDSWKKVPESEYLLQEAREKYKGDPVVRCAKYTKDKFKIKSNSIICINNDIVANCKYCDFNQILYDIETEEWAEIISTPKEEKSESNVKEVKMTHQEAIKQLSQFNHIGVAEILENDIEAINYAIEQLNKCEVFLEPVKMEVSSENRKWIKRLVYGNFLKQTIYRINDEFYAANYCRPIKKEPLSFTEWRGENNITRHNDGCGLWNDEFLNSEIREYTEYLNNFNK